MTTTQKNTVDARVPQYYTDDSGNYDEQGYDAYGLRFTQPPEAEGGAGDDAIHTHAGTSAKAARAASEKLRTTIDKDIAARTMDVMCNPNLSKAEFGALAEYLTYITLTASGMQVLERNYHTRYGEIDLIMLDGDTIAFVEVKARRSVRFGTPEEAVNLRKQQRIRRAAVEWLRSKPENLPHTERVRFDVAAIQVHDYRVKCALITSAF
jgi:putative endonuclease